MKMSLLLSNSHFSFDFQATVSEVRSTKETVLMHPVRRKVRGRFHCFPKAMHVWVFPSMVVAEQDK